MRPPGTGGGSHGVGIVRSGVPPQGEQQPTPGGMTPLLFAARDGLLDAARLLVEAGADVQPHRSERHHAAGDGASPTARFDVAAFLLNARRRCEDRRLVGAHAALGRGGCPEPCRPQRRADQRQRRRSRGGAEAHRGAPRTRRRSERARQGIPADAALPAAARLARMGGLYRSDRVHPRRTVR